MRESFSQAINQLIFYSLIVAVIILTLTSIVIQDVTFVKEKPIAFVLELLVISVFSALIMVLVFAKTRNVNIKDTITWFFALMAKFALFHILFQLSGVYAVVFPS